MMICSAQMRPEKNPSCNDCKLAQCTAGKGFTLVEFMIVIAIIGMFVLLVHLRLFGLLTRNTFKSQIQEFVSTMQMATAAAAESNRRYEIIIDLIDQRYTLRQITSDHLPSDVLEEEIIFENEFSENCRVIYVLFDDLVETDENHQIAKFRAGNAGWQNGGKIVFIDQDEQPYSVVVNRINRIVKLEEGDVEILMPKPDYEMQF